MEFRLGRPAALPEPVLPEPGGRLQPAARALARESYSARAAMMRGAFAAVHVVEYNHSITAALKHALDQAYVEWVRKPFSAFG